MVYSGHSLIEHGNMAPLRYALGPNVSIDGIRAQCNTYCATPLRRSCAGLGAVYRVLRMDFVNEILLLHHSSA